MDLIDAAFTYVEINADVGIAKAVTGLHGIADQKQRAAVAVLPAGSQLLE